MPIIEKDPWRQQYFNGVRCPDSVAIPTDDTDCFELYLDRRWVYNKLLICETQGLSSAPHGIYPPSYPVFSKPIYNLRGMGAGSKIIHSVEEYEHSLKPGHMWMTLCEGEHVSSDAAVVDGQPVWWRHTVGKALPKGMFDYWTIEADARPELEAYCADWVRKNLEGYSGCLNFETIGGKIVECHLRFADQWPDLYGKGWIDAVVDLYTNRRWEYTDNDRRTGFSAVLFGGHGIQYTIDSEAVDALRRLPEISSIQITFHQNRPPERHSMPPGGFRLAIVNCWNLEAGLDVREKLALLFWSTQKLRSRGRHSSKAKT